MHDVLYSAVRQLYTINRIHDIYTNCILMITPNQMWIRQIKPAKSVLIKHALERNSDTIVKISLLYHNCGFKYAGNGRWRSAPVTWLIFFLKCTVRFTASEVLLGVGASFSPLSPHNMKTKRSTDHLCFCDVFFFHSSPLITEKDHRPVIKCEWVLIL